MVWNVFCARNKMIVNEAMTKLMIFGKKKFTGEKMFNGKRTKLVSEYEYLGNIIRSTETMAQDMFSTNYPYLCDRAYRATVLAWQKLKNVQHPRSI